MPDPTAKPPEDEWGPTRNEILDVVLIKDGVAPHNANPEDFRRINVAAEGTYAAAQHADVVAAEKEGYTILQVVKPGFQNEHERAAKDRANSAGYTDRTKV
jgi:hypothetical protein